MRMRTKITPLDGLGEYGGLCVRCFGFRFFLGLLLAELHVSRRRRIRAVVGGDFDHFTVYSPEFLGIQSAGMELDDGTGAG